MDKNLNNLDPKLKEAYERVMATNFNPQSSEPQSQQAAPPAQPAQENTMSQPLMQTQPVEQPTAPAIQTIPQQPPPPQNYSSPLPTQNPFAQTPVPPPTVLTQAGSYSAPAPQKKGHGLMPLLFLVLGAIFFAAYTVIWAKIFGLL